MKRTTTLWGGLLLVAGCVLLLLNIGVFGAAEPFIWTLLFGIGGALFLGLFTLDRAQWWSAIPGFVLLGLGTLTLLDQIAPRWAAIWGGPLLLGSISLGFWTIALLPPRVWWAVIPGGVLLTLAIVAGLDQAQPGQDRGGIVLLGFAATFGVVALFTPGGKRMAWALIPAAVLTVIGTAVLTGSAALLNYLWPLGLIGAGLSLLYRARRHPVIEPEPQPAAQGKEGYNNPTLPQPH